MITHYGFFRSEAPNSPLIRDAETFTEQEETLKQEFQDGVWEPIEDCKTNGEARRKFAASKHVALDSRFWGEK